MPLTGTIEAKVAACYYSTRKRWMHNV